MKNLFNLPRTERGIEEEIELRMNADKRGYEVRNKKPKSRPFSSAFIGVHPRFNRFP